MICFSLGSFSRADTEFIENLGEHLFDSFSSRMCTTCTTPRDQENNKHDKYIQMRIARQEMQIGISRTEQESRRVL